jgi:hypothetical protein
MSKRTSRCRDLFHRALGVGATSTHVLNFGLDRRSFFDKQGAR